LGIADPDASLELHHTGHLGLVEHATAGAVTRLTFSSVARTVGMWTSEHSY